MSWREVHLGDVIRLKRGHDLPSSDRVPGEIPIVSSSGVTGFHNVAKVAGPGVVTGRYGTLGEVHYIEGDYWPLNTALYVEDFKGNQPRYVAYLLMTLELGSQNAAGAVPGVNRNTLHQMTVCVPDEETQRRIVEVLSAYDDLIATNQLRIALLEDAARRLYREWFVHLRFPGHESVLVKDGVPEGWCKKPIAEQTSFLNRGITPKYDDTAKGWVINQKCIRDGRISMEPARRQSKEVKPDRLIRSGDVLINSTGAGTLGRVAQVRAPIENCTVDTHVTIARPLDEGSSTYFGQALLELASVFSEMGKGATNQLELSRSDIGAVEIWQPPQHLHVEFHRLVGPMLEQAEQLSVANLSLEKTRDLLLPKLMSGQLDVSGIALPDEVAA